MPAEPAVIIIAPPGETLPPLPARLAALPAAPPAAGPPPSPRPGELSLLEHAQPSSNVRPETLANRMASFEWWLAAQKFHT
jgi:hypothetical protein